MFFGKKNNGAAAVRSVEQSARLEQAKALIEVQKTATAAKRETLNKLHVFADEVHADLDNFDAEIEQLMGRL